MPSMKLFLLFVSFVAVTTSSDGRTPETCTVGSKWTSNYIRFECYAGSGSVLKGVRPIGCVPSNSEDGELIKPSTKHSEQYFIYECKEKDDVMAYEIINCRDHSGATMAIGETKEQADGSTWRCYRDSENGNRVMLAQETPGGCKYGGKTYTEGQTWTQPLEFKAIVDGKEHVIGKSVRMQCYKSGSGFSAKATGCVTSTGATLGNNQFGQSGDWFVKCSISSSGSAELELQKSEDMQCVWDGKRYNHSIKFNDNENKTQYTCSYGVVSKTACIINGKEYRYNTLTYINDQPYLCAAGVGYFDFGNVRGCTLSDGSFKTFMSKWEVNGTIQRCRYTIQGELVTTYIETIACAYEGKEVSRNTIITQGEGVIPLKCAFENNTWIVRKLTEVEYKAYLEGQSSGGNSNVIGGNGGSGSGGDITQKPTTTEEPTEAPTTTTEEPTTEAPTTTTEKITEATTITEKTTEMTTTEVTEAPTTTTERTEAPTTTEEVTQRATTTTRLPETTTSVEETKSSSVIVTERATTEEPTSMRTTTRAGCHNTFEFCSSLTPLCSSNHTASLGELRDLVKSSNISIDQLRQILSAMGIDQPPALTSSEEDREEVEKVIRGLAGDTDEDEGCGCRDDVCASKCVRRQRKSCKRCGIFKKKLHELVLILCPSTCNSCDRGGKVSELVQLLVRFYTHDCK